jgi:hypothetical protein
MGEKERDAMVRSEPAGYQSLQQGASRPSPPTSGKSKLTPLVKERRLGLEGMHNTVVVAPQSPRFWLLRPLRGASDRPSLLRRLESNLSSMLGTGLGHCRVHAR